MRIVKVTVSLHRLSMKMPLRQKPINEGLRVICQIETDTGHTGFGMTGRCLAHGVANAIKNDLVPLLADVDIENFEAVHSHLWRAITPRGTRTGMGMAALSCLDMAIWDVVGKSRGQTVAQMFGGNRTEVDVYVTYGFGEYDQDELISLGQDLAGQGYKCLKILVGVAKGGVAEDARRVKAVANALGDRVSLALDANESLSFDEAMRLCRLLDDVDIVFFEDPLRGNDAARLASLRRMGRIPVALGQFDGFASRFREWVEADAIDIFMVNSMYNGGFTETRRVAALSQIYNMPLSDAGGGGLFSLHHVAGFRNGTMLEMHLANAQLERELFVRVPEPVNGRIALLDTPGIGLELNQDLLKETLARSI